MIESLLIMVVCPGVPLLLIGMYIAIRKIKAKRRMRKLWNLFRVSK